MSQRRWKEFISCKLPNDAYLIARKSERKERYREIAVGIEINDELFQDLVVVRTALFGSTTNEPVDGQFEVLVYSDPGLDDWTDLYTINQLENNGDAKPIEKRFRHDYVRRWRVLSMLHNIKNHLEDNNLGNIVDNYIKLSETINEHDWELEQRLKIRNEMG